MGRKLSNLKKAYYYYRKNGFLPMLYAGLERIKENNICYEKRIVTADEQKAQKEQVWEQEELFSLLVPAYETDTGHFREMIDSVLGQTYGCFELIIADASASDKLREVMQYYNDSRIRYIRVAENKGISENTNAALQAAGGSYIGLLDHDDVLESDALYRMMEAIRENRKRYGSSPWMLYSDEDKGDGTMSRFYEPHIKGKFNLDLLLSNHYICHFLVMKAELMKTLGFRREYDGAQDHDLVLRAVDYLQRAYDRQLTETGCIGHGALAPGSIVHVPYVLYHWRCHTGSTAENPQSKLYAYEAGRRAVEDFCRWQGWQVRVVHTPHLGFFRILYEGDVLEQRSDLAAVGGKLVFRGRITGGAYEEDGSVLYQGLWIHFSGYMHRAVLQQDVAAVDIRHIRLRRELQPVLDRIQNKETDPVAVSLRLGEEAARMGYRILWDPLME